MPVEATRRMRRATATTDDAGCGGALPAVHNGPFPDGHDGRGGRSERFFADRHGIRPDPAFVVGLDIAVADDALLRRHWIVACADPHR